MSQLKLEILLDMANKVSAPLKAMQADTKFQLVLISQ